jgi:hypothetical protein
MTSCHIIHTGASKGLDFQLLSPFSANYSLLESASIAESLAKTLVIFSP